MAAHRGFSEKYPVGDWEETAFRTCDQVLEMVEESINAALDLGIALITCNNPDEVLQILRAKRLHK